MSAAERVYGVLLRAYPSAFRAEYGREMRLLFRDQLNERRQPDVDFWITMLLDVARSAPALRIEAIRTRWRAVRRVSLDRSRGRGREDLSLGGTMTAKRVVAMLAMLGGAFEIVNAGVDVVAGGGGARDASWATSIVLAVLIGALMLVAGGALLRARPGARPGAMRLVRGAALACLVLLVGLQVVFPFMSIFSRLLAAAIPVALLIVARRHDAGPSMPSMA